MKWIHCLLGLAIVSCSDNTSYKTTQFLKIIDYEQRGIKNNGIVRTCLLSKDHNGDTIQINLYDSNGNILFMNDMLGVRRNFTYDKNSGLASKEIIGLNIDVRETTFRYSVNYDTASSGGQYFQIWNYLGKSDTTKFTFNEKGYLLKKEGINHDFFILRDYIQSFEYLNDSVLTKVITQYKSSQYKQPDKVIESYTFKENKLRKKTVLAEFKETYFIRREYYYSDNELLDSTITTYNDGKLNSLDSIKQSDFPVIPRHITYVHFTNKK